MSHPRPDEFSFHRYLAAKRTVDDRALHRPTFTRLTDAVADRETLCVLDVAAGLGTGLQRFLEWNCLPDRLDYTLLDIESATLDAARDRLSTWADEEGYTVNADSETTETLEFARDDESVTVRFVSTDALAYAAATDDRFDLLVGQAFLDLIDLDSGLPALLDLVVDDGVAYFPITFDGVTHLSSFSPHVDSDTDRSIIDAYHATMDAADRPGGSTTGREVLAAIARGESTTLVAAGGSDWVVHPPYPADEAYFLHHLVDTITGAVAGTVSDERRRAWADARHDAVAAAELTFLAHNADVLARVRR